MDTINNMPETDLFETQDQQKIPSFLNVLTILTIVASGFGLLGAIYSYFSSCKSAEMLADKEMPEMGGLLGKILSASIETAVKQCENRLVILIITLVTSALCLLGAMMMRQLKKQGLILYILGELLAPIALLIILGSTGFLTGISFFMPILFVVLYLTQQKYLVK